MKTRMSKASLDAWYLNMGIGLTSKQLIDVAEYVRKNGRKPMSNKQISLGMNLPIEAVSARRNALVHLGVLIKEPELSKCPVTGRGVSKVIHVGVKV